MRNNFRQQKVLQSIMENHGISVSQAMRDAGYSEAYASNPHEFVNTKSFQALVDDVFPAEEIVALHIQLLNKRVIRHMDFPLSMKDSEIHSMFDGTTCSELQNIVKLTKEDKKRAYYLERDIKAVIWALDTYHKIMGNYAPKKVQQISPLEDKTLEELKEMEKEIIDIEERYLRYKNTTKKRLPAN